jgi:hypothetical protein
MSGVAGLLAYCYAMISCNCNEDIPKPDGLIEMSEEGI